MFCMNCGNQLPDGANFCGSCGAKVGGPVVKEQSNTKTLNGVSINIFDFALKYDIWGRGQIDACKYLDAITHCGIKAAFTFVNDLKTSVELKNAVQTEIVARQQRFDREAHEMKGLFCPKCHSRNIHIDKKGYSLAKGVVGDLLLGPVGLIAGKHKSNKLRYTCLDCHNQWHD